MRKKKGFTLVELLVVMAIISILAAIAIPNVQKWIKKGRATSAVVEIRNMEMAITKLLSDAGRSSITDLINASVLGDEILIRYPAGAVAAPPIPEVYSIKYWDSAAFGFAVEIYTEAIYALLRVGRGALTSPENFDRSLYVEEIVRQLGTSYMADLGFDPWGELYQIYPGPWSVTNGLNPFRTYLPPVAVGQRLPGSPVGASGDVLSLGSLSLSAFVLTDPLTGEDIELVGVPAINGSDVFIWSKGANLESGQVLFRHPDIGPYLETDDINNYDISAQEPEFLGGGDDINSWDRDQTFMQFYN